MNEIGGLALDLAIVLTAARIAGGLVGRFGQPAVLGELLVGVLLGNTPGVSSVLQRIAHDPALDMLAALGMLLLLFQVGVELSVRELFAVGTSSVLVALCGTAASLALGLGAATLSMPSAALGVRLFLGAAITATSVGITARVLRDLDASRSGAARVILGAAIIDDVIALVVLGLVTGWIQNGGSGVAADWRPAAILVAKTIGFLTISIALGVKLTPMWFRRAAQVPRPGALLALGLSFCFFLSWAASAIGLAALVGAFAAGLVLEDTHFEIFVRRGERPLGELLDPMTSFMLPVFFVLVGFRTDLRVLARPEVLGFPLLLIAAAIVGKLACAAGVVTTGVRRLTVGVGMIPRGEVTLIFAALGRTLQIGGAPVLDAGGYAALVAVVIVTTLVTPVALKWSLGVAR